MTAREYGDFLKQYQAKYGPATTVFMQVGSFYELYDFQDPATGKTLYNVIEIVEILGLQTSAKTDAQSGHTILTAGLPEYALHRWASKLTQMGWTVIIVDQNKDSSGRVRNRTVSRILSPGTHIETAISTEIPAILCLLFQYSINQSEAPTYSVASLDLTTGQTKSFSHKAEGNAENWTADYLQQFICIYPPKEIIINLWSEDRILTEETFRKQFSINNHIPVHIRKLSKDQTATLSKELYRDEQLRTIYSLRSILPSRTLLSARTELEESVIILLAEYAEEHISSELKKFNMNEAWHPYQNLICANNALLQLQIIPQQQPHGFASTSTFNSVQSNPDSILSLFSAAFTPMGKRSVRERIVRPLSDSRLIRERLNKIIIFQKLNESVRKQITTQLRFIYDLPRLHRKIHCSLLTKDDVPQLIQSYSAISALMEITITNDVLASTNYFDSNNWQLFIETFHAHFPVYPLKVFDDDADTAAAADADADADTNIINELIGNNTTPFHKLNYPVLGNLEKDIRETIKKVIKVRNHFARIAGVSEESIRIESREKEPFGLKTSTVILKSLETKKKTADIYPLENITINNLKSGGWLDCQELQRLNIHLLSLYEKLDRECRLAFIEACHILTDKFFTDTTNICSLAEKWIEDIDCTACFAQTAEERGWACPDIIDDETSPNAAVTATAQNPYKGSSLEIQGLRHPIVENTRTRVSYITHDVSLGQNDINISQGWLIYGMNASGKSTLMKATGIAVILAQAGCFVPARRMILRPFRAIFTRILNQDNIFQGLSSFAVEMSELRDILAAADSRSLVLGDELCAGTESDSAQALVAAGIQWLANKGAKFLFATHLHDIPKLINLKSLGVAVWHIHVHYDPVTKKLIYDRQLREGSGSSLYGLEVARAMNLPFEFIEAALENRNKLVGEFRRTNGNKTSWTPDLIKRACELCGSPGAEQRSLEVHHIQHRASAKNGRLISGEDMNHPRNLVVLCDKCHDAQHTSRDHSHDGTTTQSTVVSRASSTLAALTASSIQQTSDGPERICITNYTDNRNQISQDRIPSSEPTQRTKLNGKWSDEQKNIIQQTLNKFPKAALKQIRFMLQSNYAISISESSLRQFRISGC